MPKTKKTAAIYVRVSTDQQNTENQEQALIAVAEKAGWTISQIYRDQGVSGAKKRSDRPAFKKMQKDAVQRQFDVILAWSVDRLGRSLQDLAEFLTELHALNIDLVLHQQGLDTTTPAGKAMFQMMGVFAEFERAIIKERVKAGLERAKTNGVKLGRPKIDTQLEEEITKAIAAGNAGIRKIAKKYSVGVGTVQRIKYQNALNPEELTIASLKQQ